MKNYNRTYVDNRHRQNTHLIQFDILCTKSINPAKIEFISCVSLQGDSEFLLLICLYISKMILEGVHFLKTKIMR